MYYETVVYQADGYTRAQDSNGDVIAEKSICCYSDDIVIQAAIDSLAPDRDLKIAGGQYHISATVIQSRIAVLAEGATITLSAAANCDMWQIEASGTKHNRVVLRGVVLDGNKSENDSGNGLVLASCAPYKDISGVSMCNCAENGILVKPACYWGTFDNMISYENEGHGFYLQRNAEGTAYQNNLTFIGCQADENGLDGFHLEKGNGIRIIGGSVESNAGWGIQIEEGNNCVLLGTWTEGNGQRDQIRLGPQTNNCMILMPRDPSGYIPVSKGHNLLFVPGRIHFYMPGSNKYLDYSAWKDYIDIGIGGSHSGIRLYYDGQIETCLD